ncbi:MAG TPA: nucleotide excision repair endonuclease [Mycobacteriales bacterium]|nr:nucleotide excision repair endonuclease [Mycobacteriales bacterium]
MTEEWGRIGLGVLRAAAADAPRDPGVYFFLDEIGDIIYVGKATDLRARLRQHAAAKPSTYRLHQKYDLVRRVRWERTADEEAALWREADLIFALQPPYNGDPDRRASLLGPKSPVLYIVVTEDGTGTLRFTLEANVPENGRAYGCFPHLGKGVGSDIGIACSDGYTALLRLLWAATGEGEHIPATITRSAPLSFSVPAPAGLNGNLHRFLSGTRARLADELLAAAAHRPPFMQPGLRADRAAALRFFAAGPKSVRAVRLRHRVRARVIDETTYRRLVRDEIAPLVAQPQD